MPECPEDRKIRCNERDGRMCHVNPSGRITCRKKKGPKALCSPDQIKRCADKDGRTCHVNPSGRVTCRKASGAVIKRQKCPDDHIEKCKLREGRICHVTPTGRFSCRKKQVRKKVIKKTPSPQRKTPSPKKKTPSPQRKTPSPQKKTPSPQRKTPSPQKKTPSPQKKTPSPQKKTPSPQKKTPSPRRKTPSPTRLRSPSPVNLSPKSPLIPLKPTISKKALIDEIKGCFEKVMFSTPQTAVKQFTQGRIAAFDLSFTNFPTYKVYGLKGKLLLDPVIRPLIPLNHIPNSRPKRALYNKVHGYMYFKNPENMKKLSYLQELLLVLDKKYAAYTIQDEVAPLNKTFGIIGWDIPYTDPKWVTDIVGSNWDPKLNPSIDQNKIIRFGKIGISVKMINKSVLLLRKHDKDFNRLSSTYYKSDISEFFKETATVAFCAWGHVLHARCMLRDDVGKTVYFIDPWKQRLENKEIPGICQANGYKCEFIVRKPEQLDEGSCTAIAFMRAIMAAKFGKVGLTMDMPLEYIVLTSRLISKFR